MNFDLASELAAGETETDTVVGIDDVASAPPERSSERRGVAGLFFAYKCAGAAAERGASLAQVTATARSAVANTRSMGVGLSPTILPAAGKPTFELVAILATGGLINVILIVALVVIVAHFLGIGRSSARA